MLERISITHVVRSPVKNPITTNLAFFSILLVSSASMLVWFYSSSIGEIIVLSGYSPEFVETNYEVEIGSCSRMNTKYQTTSGWYSIDTLCGLEISEMESERRITFETRSVESSYMEAASQKHTIVEQYSIFHSKTRTVGFLESRRSLSFTCDWISSSFKQCFVIDGVPIQSQVYGNHNSTPIQVCSAYSLSEGCDDPISCSCDYPHLPLRNIFSTLEVNCKAIEDNLKTFECLRPRNRTLNEIVLAVSALASTLVLISTKFALALDQGLTKENEMQVEDYECQFELEETKENVENVEL